MYITQTGLYAQLAVRRNKIAKSTSAEVKTWHERYPWAQKYLGAETVTRFYTSEIEPQILDLPLQVEEMPGGGIIYENVYLVDAMGDVVIRRKTLSNQKTVTFEGYVYGERTIRRIFNSLEEKGRDIHRMLSFYPRTATAIVYEPPTGISFFEWLNCLQQFSKAS